jgi:hypothetical protein
MFSQLFLTKQRKLITANIYSHTVNKMVPLFYNQSFIKKTDVYILSKKQTAIVKTGYPNISRKNYKLFQQVIIYIKNLN